MKIAFGADFLGRVNRPLSTSTYLSLIFSESFSSFTKRFVFENDSKLAFVETPKIMKGMISW